MNWIKILGYAGTLLGVAATVIGNYSQQKDMEATIEKKVNEAIANKNNEEESE